MYTHVNRRGVVGIVLFLVAVVAGCAQAPAAAPPQEVQELREQVATLEARVQEAQAAPAPTATQQMMGGVAGPVQSMDMVPPVKGYYAGEEILFIHTEASDPQVAHMLTTMMGPQVVLVPRLAEVPKSLLANLYVFTNGIQGGGPFGFQPDVFDAVPGDEGYSPLRAINLVAWQEGVTARELRSVEEVEAAESKREVTIKHPGIVVNMPVLTWPGGHR